MKCCSSVLDILSVPADQKVNHFEKKTICRSGANEWQIDNPFQNKVCHRLYRDSTSLPRQELYVQVFYEL